MGYCTVNKARGVCFRCGKSVEAGEGLFMWGNGTWPWPWDQHRFRWNLPLVEHLTCHEKYKNTGVHWQFAPDASDEGFDDDLGLQTDYDP